ncbi:MULTISPECIES: DUF5047 domain-containing protein [unclassified Streptomyces]|uniref:DUF5047 domain-containing protein n=1 Tax=unclassified Streptomyces TaxID=2593676 RepID=UPI00081E9FFE|nr:DUF5047 domain-containing protein [Streptomyces sp. ScaeMP-e83]MYR93387.1 DUF5047 domain-containing protein [Streptomyces sp. SID4937]SCD51761.1 protein of unknown function [Streptomyces sp. ScaeMP-e83]
MRTVSARWAPTVARTHPVVTEVNAHLGATLLAAVPITAGQVVFDVSARGRRRCTVTVPLVDRGTRWDPGSDPAHPLAAYGQQLHIRTGVRHLDGTAELLNLGRYLITDTDTDESEGTVTVSGSDLYQRMDESRIISNLHGSFGTAYTYREVAERLTYVGLNNPFIDDPRILPTSFVGLTDRNLAGPVEVEEGTERTAPLETLCAAWPADMAVNDAGALEFRPPVTAPAAVPVARIVGNTPTATLAARGRRSSRQRVYNAVYAIGTDPATGAQRAIGSAAKTTGPLAVTGPNGWVSRWYSSPLLLNNAQAQAAANTLLARGTLYTRTEAVTAVPDPALMLNDTVEVVSDGAGTFKGLVASITLPLTASGGPMTLTVTNETGEA